MTSRHAGLMLPLFSAASTSSWGLGELPDIVPLARWMARGGYSRVMILPIGTVPEGETSPYSATSTMAIDPIYIAPDAMEDFRRAGGVAALSSEARTSLDAARASPAVRYPEIRRVKREALALAFQRFLDEEWGHRSVRAAELAAYIARQGWWLDDYALYRAIATRTGQWFWRDWPAPIRDRLPPALDEARRQGGTEVLRQQYLQWIAESQWQAARAEARAAGVTVVGDLPFMVGAASAEVWARPSEFWLDVSLGVPPDAFSETGQDWGLPTPNWEAIARSDYAWVRQRAARMAALYDGYRVDHLIGLYRTYGRPPAGPPFFSPPHEAEQIRQGEHIMRLIIASGAGILGEDLGAVPDFLRASLARLNVAGCKVLRWEREWDEPGQPFIDPATYPPVSAAMTGTHDTEPMAEWWDEARPADRAALLALPSMHAAGVTDPARPWDDALRAAMLDTVWAAGSIELLVPIQDVFGWRDRINTPATVTDRNWTWRLPWPVNRLDDVPEARAAQALTLALGQRYGRA